MKRILIAVVFLSALLFFVRPASAQTIVTGTFLVPSGQTPQAAKLKVLQQVGLTPVCGETDFQAYDSVGNKVIRLIWNNVTYFPQRVRGFIRCSDGALISSSGSVGVPLIPNVSPTINPVGTVYQLSGSLTASTDGTIAAQTWTEQKQIPDQSSVDWSSLPVVQITIPQFAIVIGVGAFNLDLEDPSTSDSGTFQWEPKSQVNLKRISCSVDTGLASINFDIRSESVPNTPGSQMLSVSLPCTPTTGSTTSFAIATIPAQTPIALLITAISGSPGVVRIHAEY